MNHLRHYLAVVMWAVQGTRLWLWWRGAFHGGYAGGRRVDWLPVHCPECAWRGPLRWAIHDYDIGIDDSADPRDGCPRCFADVSFD